MPLIIETSAKVSPGSYPSYPVAKEALRAIGGAGSDLHRWFDAALTDGAQIDAAATGLRWMDCWDEVPTRLDLVSGGSLVPTLAAGGNGAKAVSLQNTGSSPYGLIGAPNSADLVIPDPSKWSIVVACRPMHKGTHYLFGHEAGEPITPNDRGIDFGFTPGGGRTQCPRLQSTDLTATRILDNSHEYAHVDSVVAIGFDTVRGLTISRNGSVVVTAPDDRLPLTSTRFQIGGVGAGTSSLNWRGLVYGILLYRQNLFDPRYADHHRAAVKGYCDVLALAHPF